MHHLKASNSHIYECALSLDKHVIQHKNVNKDH